MRNGNLSPFGLCVKKKLLDRRMSQDELMQLVRERTGLFVDAGYLYKILTGQRNAPKIKDAIRDVLDLASDSVSLE